MTLHIADFLPIEALRALPKLSPSQIAPSHASFTQTLFTQTPFPQMGFTQTGFIQPNVHPTDLNPSGINPSGLNPSGLNPSDCGPADCGPAGPNLTVPTRFAPLQPATPQPASPLQPSQTQPGPATRHFPVLFLSDLHLGSRACRGDQLLSFLQAHTADVIYLVGDIIDTWLPLGAHWTPSQHQVLALLIDRARHGTRLIYTPGNHDAFFRRFNGHKLPGVEVVDHIIHHAADGQRYLVVHGDSCDIFDRHFPILSRISTRIDSGVRGLIGWVNHQRARNGWAEWTLMDVLVKAFNDAVRACDAFEARLADLARQHGTDGIICGHFHKPALNSDHGVSYANCGDWVENATALAETASGRLLLIDWARHGLEMPAADVHMGFGKAAAGI